MTATADTAFVVKFTNQGENDEFDVKVTVAIEGGDKPIKASRTVDTVARGQTAEALGPAGDQAADRHRGDREGRRSRKVPGEQKTDNNTASYDVLFVEG